MIRLTKKAARLTLETVYQILHRRYGPRFNTDRLLQSYFDGERFGREAGCGERLCGGAQAFVQRCKIGSEPGVYGHSPSSPVANLYSSVYAAQILSLTGAMDTLSVQDRVGWVAYLDSFQSGEDGLFYDASLAGTRFNTADWWGARHLAVHVIAAYTALQAKPRADFGFLRKYTGPGAVEHWLAQADWSEAGDFDNQVMNIGALMQYSRDGFANEAAGRGAQVLTREIERRIDPGSGLVWPSDVAGAQREAPARLSRAVQFSYHLYAVAHYDGWRHPSPATLRRTVERTANVLGGFGPALNSSACEDMDSIDLLRRYAPPGEPGGREIFRDAVTWVLANRNPDGGFVFRRGEAFEFGHPVLRSRADESDLFATWFRLLALAYLQGGAATRFGLRLRDCPGYEYDRGTL